LGFRWASSLRTSSFSSCAGQLWRRYLGGYVVLGGNLSVTLGPAGRGVSVALDPELSSPCYAYALSRGAFLGVALEGTKLSENPELNEKFWGREVKAATILSQFFAS